MRYLFTLFFVCIFFTTCYANDNKDLLSDLQSDFEDFEENVEKNRQERLKKTGKFLFDDVNTHSKKGVYSVTQGSGAFSDLWHVECNNSRGGMITVDGPRLLRTICASANHISSPKCISTERWSIDAAAEYICR